MSYRDWHVGMKVVCVRGFVVDMQQTEVAPKEGHVYTIRTISAYAGDGVYVRLAEIVNPVLPYSDGDNECDFIADNFRPVETRTTDISIFQAMLTPKRETERA